MQIENAYVRICLGRRLFRGLLGWITLDCGVSGQGHHIPQSPPPSQKGQPPVNAKAEGDPKCTDRAKEPLPGGGVRKRLPTGEEVGALHGDGEAAPEDVDVGLGDLLHGVRDGAVLPRIDHIGLQEGAFHEDPVVQHGLVQNRLHLAGGLGVGLGSPS